VIEVGVRPVAGGMAGIAAAGGDDVSGGFADGGGAVMTAGAITTDFVMVHPGGGGPAGGGVTDSAGIAAEDMGVGFAGRAHQGSGFMASGALRGGPLEYAAIMATFAIDSYVGAGQREAGGEMIEVSPCRRVSCAAERNQEQAHDSRRRYP